MSIPCAAATRVAGNMSCQIDICSTAVDRWKGARQDGSLALECTDTKHIRGHTTVYGFLRGKSLVYADAHIFTAFC